MRPEDAKRPRPLRLGLVLFFWLCFDLIISLYFSPIKDGYLRGGVFGGLYVAVSVVIWYGMTKVRLPKNYLAERTRKAIDSEELDPLGDLPRGNESEEIPVPARQAPPPVPGPVGAPLPPKALPKRVRYTVVSTREVDLEKLVELYEMSPPGSVKDVTLVED